MNKQKGNYRICGVLPGGVSVEQHDFADSFSIMECLSSCHYLYNKSFTHLLQIYNTSLYSYTVLNCFKNQIICAIVHIFGTKFKLMACTYFKTYSFSNYMYIVHASSRGKNSSFG